MMNTASTFGEYKVVFDGSEGFPDITRFLISDKSIIIAGQDYLFRVKAAYQNGFTSFSQPSQPILACSSPNYLLPPKLVSVSSTQITMKWD
jgi:hypothetical protein